MKKKIIIVLLIALIALASALALTGCNTTVGEQDAWEEFDKAMEKSSEYLQNKNYYVKYRYKEGDVTITQKLNVAYGNSNIKDWDDFVIVDRGVEKASKFKTDYVNSYFGYSLRSGVKAKKAKREDYALGYFNPQKEFSGSENAEDFFNLKAGDVYNGNEITSDTEIYKYTLGYALGTLKDVNKDNAELLSATKRGSVLTLKFIVKAEGLYYSNYNKSNNCLTVRITLGRISKISSADENQPCYYINYAGPKFSLAAYDAQKDAAK